MQHIWIYKNLNKLNPLEKLAKIQMSKKNLNLPPKEKGIIVKSVSFYIFDHKFGHNSFKNAFKTDLF